MANSKRKLSLLYRKKCRAQKPKIKLSACADRRKRVNNEIGIAKSVYYAESAKKKKRKRQKNLRPRRKEETPGKNKDSNENTSRVSMSNKNKRWKISIKRQTIALGPGAGKAGVRGGAGTREFSGDTAAAIISSAGKLSKIFRDGGGFLANRTPSHPLASRRPVFPPPFV